MKLFGRTGGYYLFWTGVVYFFIGMFNIFVYELIRSEFIQLAWILVLMLPLIIKPLARWFNMKTIWEMIK